MGRGALPDSHELAVGAGCDEQAFQQLLAGADVVLAVGTELGAETTGQWSLRPGGELIHLDVRAEHVGRTYPTAVGLVGDARRTLAALAEAVPAAAPGARDGGARAAAVRERIRRGLLAMGMDVERELLETLRAAVPPEGVTAFDMTILGYWAAPHLPVERGGSFLYPLGSGTLGYAWPAALGAKVGHPDAPVIGVHGDGGFLYASQELATARQHGIAAKLVLVDDSAYGILKVYQSGAYGATHAVDLLQPDFEALARAYGVPVFACEADGFAGALDRTLAVDGPAVTLLRHPLRVAETTS
jgi:acetolactate synthase-1/2/3 large subunit